MPDYLLKIGLNPCTCRKIPQCETAQLVIIVPVIKQLIDMLAACLILLTLRIVQVECRNLADQKSLHVRMIAFTGNLIGLIRQMELCLLVVVVFL